MTNTDTTLTQDQIDEIIRVTRCLLASELRLDLPSINEFVHATLGDTDELCEADVVRAYQIWKKLN